MENEEKAGKPEEGILNETPELQYGPFDEYYSIKDKMYGMAGFFLVLGIVLALIAVVLGIVYLGDGTGIAFILGGVIIFILFLALHYLFRGIGAAIELQLEQIELKNKEKD